MKVDVTIVPAPPRMGGPKFMVTDYDIYFTAEEASKVRFALMAAGMNDYADFVTPLDSSDPHTDSIWRGRIKDLQDCSLYEIAQAVQNEVQARLAAANAL